MALAVTVGLVLHGAMYAPQAAFFSELFATRMRYSGASIGAQFSSVAAGAPAPMIATALLAEYDGSAMISLYVIAAALLTVVALACATETRHRDLRTVGEEEPRDGGEHSNGLRGPGGGAGTGVGAGAGPGSASGAGSGSGAGGASGDERAREPVEP